MQSVQALGPTIVAVVAVLIASTIQYRQWATARDKLKLDLFDKRLAHYMRMRALIDHALSVNERSEYDFQFVRDHYRFLGETAFLFGSDIKHLSEGLRASCEKVFQGVDLRKDAGEQREGEDWKKGGKLFNEGRQELRELYSSLHLRLSRYFSLAHVS
jgi:hypothetical protein